VTAYRAADGNYAATSSASTAITIAKATPGLTYAVSTPPVFRQLSNISVTSSTAGTFKFLLNNKVIPGCHSKIANAGNGYVATCPWKPSARNYVSVSIFFSPVDSSFYAGKITGPTYLVAPRTARR
ncbi:MAG: hypothetical protein RLZZ277_28, partial [Actinomycetota bacterium]